MRSRHGISAAMGLLLASSSAGAQTSTLHPNAADANYFAFANCVGEIADWKDTEASNAHIDQHHVRFETSFDTIKRYGVNLSNETEEAQVRKRVYQLLFKVTEKGITLQVDTIFRDSAEKPSHSETFIDEAHVQEPEQKILAHIKKCALDTKQLP